ncbi:MAG: FAD-dependent oxidoreductase [Pseudomonadota bacterium]
MTTTGGTRVAVLGGGLMGCCAALELAERGASVTLFEREPTLISQASAHGEAKIHLGYVYANDRTRATARLLMRGALEFAPFFRRHLADDAALLPSQPFHYAVHRDSLLSADQVADHLAETSNDIRIAAGPERADYFGFDPAREPRRLSDSEKAAFFDDETIVAAFETPEIAIATAPLWALLRERLAADPRIEILTDTDVERVGNGGDGLTVYSSAAAEPFDHVLNASWGGRLAIDKTMDLLPDRDWLFRYKCGIRLPAGAFGEDVVSTTFVLGPFGDIVRYADGSYYLSWYPACMIAKSRAVEPDLAEAADTGGIVEESVSALQKLVPGMRGVNSDMLARATVKGGIIYALGRLDIDHPESELHHRHAIGLMSLGRYHTVDTGKLTMAPWLARQCAERILA